MNELLKSQIEASQKEVVLDVKNLVINFRAYGGKVQAVRDVSFQLHKGETVCIVGESGSGKSVSIKTVMGILAPNAEIAGGSVIYDGKDLTKITEEEFHTIRGKRIGLIFQDPLSALNPLMKIGRQITEVVKLRTKCTNAEAKERALQLMRDVGIPDVEDRFEAYPFQFSGGMRQRIVIAIALANDPEILICDEPTTALDVTVQAKILELINELKVKKGLSIIFITHDMGVVANMADRMYVMYAGKIVEYGTAYEIFFDPRHPYTWALLSSMPDMDTKEKLDAIPGTPPNMLQPPKGDAFAARNKYALKLDYVEQPPFFKVSDTHYAATWLLHPDAPKVDMPISLRHRIDRMLAEEEEESRHE